MSFFKKIRSDSVVFNMKKKKKEFKSKTKIDPDDNEGNGHFINFYKCNGVQFGNNYTLSSSTIINNNPNEKLGEDNLHFLPTDVENNFSSLVTTEMDHFLVVSQNLSKNGWFELGLKLDFSKEDLKDYSSEEEDVVRLLNDWKKAETLQATAGRLLKCLWEAKEFNAAKKLSAYIEANEK